MTMLTGIFPEMPEEVYRKTPGINFSSIKHIDVSPHEYQHQLKQPHAPSPEMYIGLVCERIVFTGKADPYILPQERPEGIDGRSKEGKEWKAKNEAWEAEQIKAGKIFVTPSVLARAARAADAVQNHPDALELLELCPHRQVPWFCEKDGQQRKGLIDLKPLHSALVDFKTVMVGGAIPEKWSKIVYERSYDAQAYWYLSGASDASGAILSDFWHIVVENDDAHHVIVRPLDKDCLKIGQMKVDRWWDRLLTCQKSGKWPGMPLIAEAQLTGNLAVKPPYWAMKEWGLE